MSKRWIHHRNSVRRKQKRDNNQLSTRELLADEIHDILRDLKQEVKRMKELQRKWQDDDKRDKVEDDYKDHARQIVKHAEQLRSRLGLPSENVKELNRISKLESEKHSLEKRLKDAERSTDRAKATSYDSRETYRESERSPREEVPIEPDHIQHSRAELQYSEEGNSMERKRKSERHANKQNDAQQKKRRQNSESSEFSRNDSKREPVVRQNTGSLRREPKLEALRNELDTVTAEKISLEEVNQKLQGNQEQLEKSLSDTKYENQRLSEKNVDALKDINKLRDNESNFMRQIQQQKQILSDKEEEIKTLREKCSGFSDRSRDNSQELSILTSQYEKQQQILADKDQEIRRIKELNKSESDEKSQLELVSLKENLSQLEIRVIEQKELLDEKEESLTKNDETIVSLTENRSKLETQLSEQKKLLDKKDTQLSDNNETMARLHQQIEHVNAKVSREKEEKNQLYESLLRSRDAEQSLRDSVDKLQANLAAERASKEEALTRLSAFAGHKLRDNNPGVTDLSDPNRPMKLAEKVSELYDNQWTNAMENLEDLGIEDNESIQLLLTIFTESYRVCREAGDRQLGPILSGHYLALPDIEDVRDKASDLQLEPLSSEISKPLKDYRKGNCEKISQYIGKVMIEKFKHMPGFNDDKVKACEVFIQDCIKYTWMMVVQDPPVHMEWAFDHGDEFDNNRLRSYTKGGKYLDFMVWPVLYLNEGGPLLAKGVGQGMKQNN